MKRAAGYPLVTYIGMNQIRMCIHVLLIVTLQGIRVGLCSVSLQNDIKVVITVSVFFEIILSS